MLRGCVTWAMQVQIVLGDTEMGLCGESVSDVLDVRKVERRLIGEDVSDAGDDGTQKQTVRRRRRRLINPRHFKNALTRRALPFRSVGIFPRLPEGFSRYGQIGGEYSS